MNSTENLKRCLIEHLIEQKCENISIPGGKEMKIRILKTIYPCVFVYICIFNKKIRINTKSAQLSKIQ